MQTKLAKAPWPKVKPKQVVPPIPKGTPRKKIDANFEDWAKRNNVDLRSMKLMGGGR